MCYMLSFHSSLGFPIFIVCYENSVRLCGAVMCVRMPLCGFRMKVKARLPQSHDPAALGCLDNCVLCPDCNRISLGKTKTYILSCVSVYIMTCFLTGAAQPIKFQTTSQCNILLRGGGGGGRCFG